MYEIVSVSVYPVFTSHNLIDWIFTTFEKKLFLLNFFFIFSFLIVFFSSVLHHFFSLHRFLYFSREWIEFDCLFLPRALADCLCQCECVCVRLSIRCILYASQNAASIIVLCHCILFLFLSLSHPLYNDLIG